MQLFNDFCNYTLDENGVLNSFQLDYPENYNFGYDVVDKMGELAPNDIAGQTPTIFTRHLPLPT